MTRAGPCRSSRGGSASGRLRRAWARGPADALEHVVADYAAFAAADNDIVRILVSEIVHLPEERRLLIACDT